MTWHAQANCLGVDANLFYPERGDYAAVMAAKAICAGCPVTEQCLEDSAGEKDGIFGGMSGRERREYRKVHGVGRACLQCGERFTARNVQHLLCSPECKKARHIEQKAESAARAWWSET